MTKEQTRLRVQKYRALHKDLVTPQECNALVPPDVTPNVTHKSIPFTREQLDRATGLALEHQREYRAETFKPTKHQLTIQSYPDPRGLECQA